jgi:rubredoxin
VVLFFGAKKSTQKKTWTEITSRDLRPPVPILGHRATIDRYRFVVLGGLLMKTWVCTVCGWIYDEAKGDSEYDLAPGVAFADLPEDFVCPLCGVGKDMFEEQ